MRLSVLGACLKDILCMETKQNAAKIKKPTMTKQRLTEICIHVPRR